MRFEGFSFGSIRIDGAICELDVAIDHGEVREREKKTVARPASHDRFRNLHVLVLRTVDCAASFDVRIHTDFAFVVENHQRAFFRLKRRPFRKAGMIGVALSREGNPGVGHSAAEFSCFATAAGHGCGTIRIVEDEGKFGAVEGARASI
jgi:hypothetical protein